MSKKIYVYGFPSLYGGAGTELHHQIIIWKKLNLDVHIIPTNNGYKNEPLIHEMTLLGVNIHKANDFECIEENSPVFGFCNSEFLDHLPDINKYSTNTVFVNCMTWLFDNEKKRMKEGLIGTFLYQSDNVRIKNEPILIKLNPNKNAKFLTFKPYFDSSKFPFIEERDKNVIGIGRISRQDKDKFSSDTLHIWEYFVSPKIKKGYMLGFDKRSEEKIGKPFDWITTYQDQRHCSQQEFYKKCDIILQPSDTTENWPRIGFEAMSSGSILIVNNRGGWQDQVIHGKTGWLCNTPQEFIYYASKMSFEPELRTQIAKNALQRCKDLGGEKASIDSWTEVFKKLNVYEDNNTNE